MDIPQESSQNEKLTSELSYMIKKKKQNLEQLLQYEQKSKQIIERVSDFNTKLLKEKQALELELKQKKKQLKDKQQLHHEQMDKLNKTIEKCKEQIFMHKNDIENRTHLFKESMQKLVTKQKSGVEMQLKIQDLQAQIVKITKSYEYTIKQMHIQNGRTIESMIQKYQGLIQQKIKQIQTQYEQELQKIRINNRTLIGQLQAKQKQNNELHKQKMKENINNQERLVAENGRLLNNNNEFKRKIIDLQHTLQARQQQLKIICKQKQIMGVNYKRQIQCLKQNKVELESKIRKMNQINEDNSWSIKQVQIQKDKQIRCIKQESQKMIDELVQSYKIEVSDYKHKLKQIQQQNRELVKKCESYKRQRDSGKQVIQFLKKQKQVYLTKEDKKSEIDQQTQNYKLKSLVSELKKQILRKNAQIEVLKQQVSRLKTKINKITIAYQQNIKSQQIMQKQNKMLLSEIVFLRDKNKSKLLSNKKIEKQNRDHSRNSSRILDLKSQHSQIIDNQNQNQLEMYKQLIVQMEKDMNEAVQKLDQKNLIIQKQKSIIQRLQRALNK